jgi:AhpD family alkylhydroperoxidase
MNEPRLRAGRLAPEGVARMRELEHYLNNGAELEASLRELVRLRVSFMNGCEYCVQFHTAELKKLNETAERIAEAEDWRSSVTNIQDGHAPDVLYEAVRAEFTDVETVNLTLVITTINAWNRITIALGAHSGHAHRVKG